MADYGVYLGVAVCRVFHNLGRVCTRRVADRTARQETRLPGKDGFMRRGPDQTQ